MGGFLSNADLSTMNGELTSSVIIDSNLKSGRDRSFLMKYPKWTRGREGRPVPIGSFIPNRQAVPQSDIIIGKPIQPPSKLPAPLRFASAPPPGNTGPDLPVWWGWRPHRPKIREADLPIVMPKSQRGPYFEAWQPSDKWIRAQAERRATTPSYATDMAHEIPNDEKYDYFDVEQPSGVHWNPSQDRYNPNPQTQNIALHGLGSLGDTPTLTNGEIGAGTSVPERDYSQEAAKPKEFPWMWVGIGGAALLLLGKRFYRG